MLKQCKVCGEWKEYDPAAKQNSKASGFFGRVCWSCYVEADRARSREGKQKLVTDPNTGEVLTAGALASRRLVTDPNTGEVITAGALANRRLVTDPNTGEVITAGALAKRRLVTDPITGEVITAGALASRKRTENGKSVEYAKEYQRNRLATDPLFKLRKNLASLINMSMKGKGYSKSTKSAALLGCDFEFFQLYIEEQFQPGMSWDNAGQWHLDHRLPVSAATDAIEMVALQHFSNFQPMWGAENIAKSDALPENHEDELQALLDTLWHREGSGDISLGEYL